MIKGFRKYFYQSHVILANFCGAVYAYLLKAHCIQWFILIFAEDSICNYDYCFVPLLEKLFILEVYLFWEEQDFSCHIGDYTVKLLQSLTHFHNFLPIENLREATRQCRTQILCHIVFLFLSCCPQPFPADSNEMYKYIVFFCRVRRLL